MGWGQKAPLRRGELVLVAHAIRQGWPTPQEKRRELMELMGQCLAYRGHRLHLAAARVLLAAEESNLAARADAPPGPLGGQAGAPGIVTVPTRHKRTRGTAVQTSLPPGAHRIGGQSAAVVHRQAARAFYVPLLPLVVELHRQGLSLRDIAAELTRRGIRTRREWDCWSATQVRRILARAAGSGGGAPAAPVQVAPPPDDDPVVLGHGHQPATGRPPGGPRHRR